MLRSVVLWIRNTSHAMDTAISFGGTIPFISYEELPFILVGKKFQTGSGRECFSLPLLKDAEFLLAVKDNTMAPHYKGGDVIACKGLSNRGLFFQWNKIYLLLTSQEVLVKRVHPGKDNDHVLLVSDNPDYPPFQLHRSPIINVALVLGVRGTIRFVCKLGGSER